MPWEDQGPRAGKVFRLRGLYKNSFHVVGLSYPSDEASKYSLAAAHA